jgi:hypothetical protein
VVSVRVRGVSSAAFIAAGAAAEHGWPALQTPTLTLCRWRMRYAGYECAAGAAHGAGEGGTVSAGTVEPLCVQCACRRSPKRRLCESAPRTRVALCRISNLPRIIKLVKNGTVQIPFPVRMHPLGAPTHSLSLPHGPHV